jgi:Kef-type K+ transport system membrane component KefB
MTGLTFLLMFLILMVLTAVIPRVLRRLYIPSVVALMITGILIGPHCFDLIRHLNRFLGRGYPTEQLYIVIEALGLLGLVFLMALAGMEVDLRMLKAEKKAVLSLSLLTFLLPAAAGYATYTFFMPEDTIGKWVYASLFASHSVGIVFPVIRELKAVRTRFGVAVLASTVITDLGSLILFAICVQLKRHALGTTVPGSISLFDKLNPAVIGPFWFFLLFLVTIVVYIAIVLIFVPAVGQRIFKYIPPNDDTRLTLFLVSVLAVVFFGELIGVSVIVGAFIAGMAIFRIETFHDHGRILHKKAEGIGYGFIIPFLFLTIGMKTDFKVLFSAVENIAIVLVTVTMLVASKVFSGWLALRAAKFSNAKGLCAGLMTVPQLSATLAAAAVALQLDMIEPRFFNAIVCLSILTTIPVPTLVRMLIIRKNIKFDSLDEKVEAIFEEVEPFESNGGSSDYETH